MTRLKLTIPFLQHCVDQNILTQLCYFIKLKTRYKNSCYYGKRIQSISAANGNSASTTSKYISYFLARGWCHMHGSNIIFKRIKEVMEVEGVKAMTFFPLQTDTTQTFNIKLAIRKLLFQNNIRKQQYIISKRSDLQNPANLKGYKSALKAKDKYASLRLNEGENNADLQCTVHGLSDIWNCSIATATRIKKQFVSQGWYQFIRRYNIVTHFVSRYYFTFHFQQEHPSRSFYWFKGTIYQSLPSIVCILNRNERFRK